MTATLAPADRTVGERRGILAGTAGIVATVLAFGVSVPELPTAITAESGRAYLVDNADALRLFGFSLAATAVLLVVMLSQLRTLMGRTMLGDVAYGSGVLCSVWLLVSGAFHATTTMDGLDGVPDGQVLSYFSLMSVGDTIGSVSTYAKGACLLAVGLAAVRTRFLPRWLGWLSIALGAMAIGGGLGIVDNPVTGALWYGGLLGFAVWPLLVGVTLVVKGARTRRTEA